MVQVSDCAPCLNGIERLADINSMDSVGPSTDRRKRLAGFCLGDEATKATKRNLGKRMAGSLRRDESTVTPND